MTQCMLQMSSFKNHSPVVDVWFVLYLAFGVQGWSMNWESPWARCLPHSICLRVCELGNQWKSAVWRGKYQVSHQSEAIYTIAHSPARVSEDISLITSGFWTVESRLGARALARTSCRAKELRIEFPNHMIVIVACMFHQIHFQTLSKPIKSQCLVVKWSKHLYLYPQFRLVKPCETTIFSNKFDFFFLSYPVKISPFSPDGWFFLNDDSHYFINIQLKRQSSQYIAYGQ